MYHAQKFPANALCLSRMRANDKGLWLRGRRAKILNFPGGKFGNGAALTSILPVWQRGREDCTNLASQTKYLSSPLKRFLSPPPSSLDVLSDESKPLASYFSSASS